MLRDREHLKPYVEFLQAFTKEPPSVELFDNAFWPLGQAMRRQLMQEGMIEQRDDVLHLCGDLAPAEEPPAPMEARTEISEETRPYIAVKGQFFYSKQDWIRRARYALTAHPFYRDTEHGQEEGWRGEHFTALCFDQLGRRCRNGGDFERAEKEQTYPIWWVWPDQIAPLLMDWKDEEGASDAS